MKIDFRKEVDINRDIAQITRDLRIKDALRGRLRCPKCNSKLRYTIRGTYLCPKCLREDIAER